MEGKCVENSRVGMITIDDTSPVSPDWYRGCVDFGNPSLYMNNCQFADKELTGAVRE